MSCSLPDGSARPGFLFYRVRVALLLLVLFGVLLYAARDVRRRRARNDWDHTLEVAVIVARRGPVAEGAIASLRAQLPALADRLYEESRRHGVGAIRPFHFTLVGPVDVAAPPPVRAEGIPALLTYLRERARYVDAIDAGAPLVASAYDARIYLVASPPRSAKRAFIEDESEQGGRVGLVTVELAEQMTGLALIVIAHELFHTLGATDKYDAEGQTRVPSGLVSPAQRPLYPQGYVDVMARLRPISPTEGVLPESVEELGIGPVTAAEIGWRRR